MLSMPTNSKALLLAFKAWGICSQLVLQVVKAIQPAVSNRLVQDDEHEHLRLHLSTVEPADHHHTIRAMV